MVAAALLLPGYADRVPADPWVLLKAYALIPQPPESGGPTGAPLLVAAWTLHYEVVFYVVFGAWLVRPALGVAVTALLAGNFLACVGGGCGFYRDFLASTYFVAFVIGALAAWASRRLPATAGVGRLAGMAIAAYAVLALLEYASPVPTGGWAAELAFALMAGIVLLTLTLARRARGGGTSPTWLRLLSDSSYALFLLHFPLISALLKLLTWAGLEGTGGATAAFAITFAVCVAAAIAFHRVVERPVARWLR